MGLFLKKLYTLDLFLFVTSKYLVRRGGTITTDALKGGSYIQ
jgi:hypothetical protein